MWKLPVDMGMEREKSSLNRKADEKLGERLI